MKSRFTRHLVALAVTACAALAVPALADANSTVTYNGGLLTYAGEDAVNNVASISLNAAATTYTITDSENITTTDCAGSGTTTVTCTATTPGDDQIDLDGRDGNDTLSVDTSAAPATSQPSRVEVGDVFTEAGNDHIDLSKWTNPDGNSDIIGGPGNDDEIAGSADTDFVMGVDPDGADTLVGGPGFDFADYRSRSGNLTLNAADGLANDGEADEHDNIGSTVDELEGGDGNDNLTAAPVDAELDGGGGNDTLTGGPGSDFLEGDDGNNVISAGSGDDFIFGSFDGADTVDAGPGDDSIEVVQGAEDIHGGDGFDTVELGGGGEVLSGILVSPPQDVSVTLDDLANDGASGEGANIHSDIEDISTGGGNDSVVGSNASEAIFTNGGNDVVSPGGGFDQVETGAGDDTIDARDGIFDRIGCGPGSDTVTDDDIDALSGCENVSSVAVPVFQGPPDRKAAKVTISRLAKHLARKKFLKSGFTLRLTPSEPVRLLFTLTGHAHGAHIGRNGDVVVATKSLSQSGARRTVRLKPSKHLHFGRHFKLQLQVLAIDGGGNVTKVNRTISVR